MECLLTHFSMIVRSTVIYYGADTLRDSMSQIAPINEEG